MATREVSDGIAIVERWTNQGTDGYYAGDPLVKQRDLTAAEAADLAAVDAINVRTGNRATLAERATQALATNNSFLGIASPSNAQTLAQVKALTKECSALIRLLLDQLDDVTGT